MTRSVLPEDFAGAKAIYDDTMAANMDVHDVIYPEVFGTHQYVGQFSDNSAAELKGMGELMGLAKDSEVLDIGCGRGNVAKFMAQTFGWKITGIDLSHVAFGDAIRRSGGNGRVAPTLICGNIYEHVFGKLFNAVYGTGAFCHFDASRLFAHIGSLLLPNGRMAFMERTRRGDISQADWENLTARWSCPYVYTTEEYEALLENNDFRLRHVLDLTPSFRVWQQRSVTVRKNLRKEIVALSSPEYYEASLAFASYENDVTLAGLLGYVCMVAERSP